MNGEFNSIPQGLNMLSECLMENLTASHKGLNMLSECLMENLTASHKV